MKKILMVIVALGMIIALGSCATVEKKSEVRSEKLEVRSPKPETKNPPESNLKSARGRSTSLERSASGGHLTSNIKGLVRQLGSDDWRTRDSAQKKLEDWPSDKLAEIEPALKEAAAKSPDPEVRMRADLIIKVIEFKKRFSPSLLKEFPNLYRDLARPGPAGKVGFLRQITAPDEEGKPKYEDVVMKTDIAELIGETLLEPDVLTTKDKIFILSLSQGHFQSKTGRWGIIPGSVPYIRKLLKDKSSSVRGSAVGALASLGDRGSIPAIRELLKDENRFVRRSAVAALARLGDKESILALRGLLKDEEEYVRGWAAISLVELGAKDSVPKEIIDDIKPILKWSEDEAKRARAALKELGMKVAEEKK